MGIGRPQRERVGQISRPDKDRGEATGEEGGRWRQEDLRERGS